MTAPPRAVDARDVPIEVGGERLPPEALDLLASFVADGHASAASLGVVRGGGGRSCAALGWTDAPPAADLAAPAEEAPSPCGLDAIFDLASLTKPMATLALVARRLEQRRWALDTPLSALLPEASGAARATVAQLLGHASGLPAWLDMAAAWDRGVAPRPVEVRATVSATPLAQPSGTEAVYSDLGYLLLGFAIERDAACSLDRAFAQEIACTLEGRARFAPLLLRPDGDLPRAPWPDGARVVATEVWPRRCRDGRPLQGRVHDDNAAALGGSAGHAGLFADLGACLSFAGHWLRALSPGDHRGGGGPSPALAQLLTRTAAAPATTWRLGWDSPSRPTSSGGRLVSDDAFGHLGFVGTSVWIDPARDAAVVLLTNRVRPGRSDASAIRALRPALHDVLWAWIDSRRGQ